MNVVLDASGAAEIVLRRANAVDFYNTLMRSGKVLAPDLYVADVANTQWKESRRFNTPQGLCEEMIQDCIGYVDEFVLSGDLWKDALRISFDFNHSIYDMLYVALAKREGAILLTVDEKLREICGKLSVRTREVY
jgi:predicted nucleic acid-binding protein